MSARTIGVVGLGKMGLPIQRHIVRGGFEATGFDLSVEATSLARAEGLETSSSVADLAEACNTVLVVVDAERAVNAVVDEVIATWNASAHQDPKRTIVILATVTITAMRALAERVTAGGYGVLDGPLCRGEKAAVDGELLTLLGGDETLVADILPIIQTFSDDHEHVGDIGAGQAAKLVNNLVLWASITATSEGFWLAEEFGVDLHKMRKALLKSSGRTWALETWYRDRDMPWAVKDMGQVLEEANRVGLALPMSGLLHEEIKTVRKLGLPGSTPPAA